MDYGHVKAINNRDYEGNNRDYTRTIIVGYSLMVTNFIKLNAAHLCHF